MGLRLVKWLTIALLILQVSSCTVSYSFKAGVISADIKTFSVEYFPNRAPVVQAQLSQYFTDALIEKIQSNTSLELVPSGGDVVFSGEIRNYDTKPTAITSQETAARNRLTIGVLVRFSNSVEPDNDFESSFSRYEDYDASLNLTDVENELIELIVENMVEDIYNKAFVNW
ncbi:MAG: LptE family protein [Bacteroidota bacterium]